MISNIIVILNLNSLIPAGIAADVNAFGWGFASAASRALRHPDLTGEGSSERYAYIHTYILTVHTTYFHLRLTSPVMVPGIDIAQHSPNPTCKGSMCMYVCMYVCVIV